MCVPAAVDALVVAAGRHVVVVVVGVKVRQRGVEPTHHGNLCRLRGHANVPLADEVCGIPNLINLKIINNLRTGI